MTPLRITALITLALVASLAFLPQSPELGKQTPSLKERLRDLPADERANRKADEIVSRSRAMTYQYDDLTIEVISIEKIDGGVQVFAKAWRDGKPLGFGSDGSVEIERFKIYNPPVMVPERRFSLASSSFETVLVENPQQALRESVAQTIQIVGKEGTNIVEGKVGNTTSTFYPTAGTGSAPVDGIIYRNGVNETFSTIRGGAGTLSDDTGAELDHQLSTFPTATTNQFTTLSRGITGFNTSTLAGEDISSATFSLYLVQVSNGLGSTGIDVVSVTPASESSLSSSDYAVANFGSTIFATNSGTTLNQYHDWTLDSNGIAYINKSGNTMFGTRLEWDVDNSFGGSWSNKTGTRRNYRTADQTGSTEDPKLVVVHETAVVPSVGTFFWGEE